MKRVLSIVLIFILIISILSIKGVFAQDIESLDETGLTGIKLNFQEISLVVGDTDSEANWGLIVVAEPNGAELPEIKWTSSDSSVVTITKGTVSSTAKPHAVSAGSATITASTADGKYTATCKVTVKSSGYETVDTNEKKNETVKKNETTTTNTNTNTQKKTENIPYAGVETYFVAITIIALISLVSYIAYRKNNF